MNPRRSGFCCFSCSVQSTASNDPLFPASPSSGGFDPLSHFHTPGSVAVIRTLNDRAPSQNPYTLFLKFGPARSTHTVASVYGLAKSREGVSVNSGVSHTSAVAAPAGAANAASKMAHDEKIFTDGM